MLSLAEDAPKVLGGALRSYLNTRDAEVHAFLRQSLFLLLLYGKDPGNAGGSRRRDQDLVDRCADLDLGRASLPEHLYKLFRSRLMAVRWDIFRPYYLQFLRRFRESLHRIPGLPANLKTNTFGVMRGLVDGERPVEQARVRFARLMAAYNGHIPDESAARFRSVLENFLEKLGQADKLFDDVFSASNPVQGSGAAGRNGEEELGGSLVVERELQDPEYFACYPTKDCLDLLRGEISGDCTAQEELARAHLAHSKFFNIRIFRKTAWVGCVYALDFTDRDPPTIVLDRIQFGGHGRDVPEPVFAELLNGLAQGLFGGIGARVIAPYHEISNASWVRSCFRNAVAGRPSVMFSMGAEDRRFASYGQGTCVVLLGAE
jgi:hypothetical protein